MKWCQNATYLKSSTSTASWLRSQSNKLTALCNFSIQALATQQCKASKTSESRIGTCVRALFHKLYAVITDLVADLEISKPQKNSRNALATAAGDSLRASHYRRSRSPDYGRRPQAHGLGPRPGIDRFVPSSDFRDELRRRDDYRSGRSPSPRGYRGRDEYRSGRDRSPDRYYGGRRSRSRSPFGRNARYRSPSPRVREIDEEASLPIPRRDARDVPDVQLILIDELDRLELPFITANKLLISL